MVYILTNPWFNLQFENSQYHHYLEEIFENVGVAFLFILSNDYIGTELMPVNQS